MKHTCETDWEPCAPGVLHEAAHDEAAMRRKFLKFIGMASLMVLLSGFVAWGVTTSLRSEKIVPPELACIEVHQNLIAYVRGRIKDDQLKSQITSHLLKCDGCNEALEEVCCSAESGCLPRPRRAILKPNACDKQPCPCPCPSPSP
jgi:hypothetical protein